MTSKSNLKRSQNPCIPTEGEPATKKARSDVATTTSSTKDDAMLLVYLSGHSDSDEHSEDEERAVTPSSTGSASGEDKREEAEEASPTAATKSRSSNNNSSGGRVRLPDKLMGFLNAKTPVVPKDLLWWQPDGDGFAFDNDRVQKDFLDVQFRGTKLASFIRSLNRWGFRRIFYHSLPKNALSFHHPLFQRKKPELLEQMKMVGGTHALMDRVAAQAKMAQAISTNTSHDAPTSTPPASPKRITAARAVAMPTPSLESPQVLGNQVLLSQLVQVRPVQGVAETSSASPVEPLWKKILLANSMARRHSLESTAPASPEAVTKTQLQQLVAAALRQQQQAAQPTIQQNQQPAIQRLLELVRGTAASSAPAPPQSALLQLLQQAQHQAATTTTSAPAAAPTANPLATQLVQAQLAQQQALRQLVDSQRRMLAIQQQLQQAAGHKVTN